MPSRFRKERVLVLGCGDIGVRMLKAQRTQAKWMALTSSAQRVPALRALGATPLQGNLDKPHTLRRLAGIAHRVVYLAPPPPKVGRIPVPWHWHA